MNRFAICLLPALLAIPAVHAQDPAPPPPDAETRAMIEAWQKAATPGAQHAQLAEHFAGTWNTKQTVWMDPAAPPSVETGRDVSTAELGGRQIRTEFTGSIMGQAFQGHGLLGYDNTTGKYQSFWTDSMSTAQMTASGDYDPATRTYTFRSEMPDPMDGGAPVPVRQTIRIVDADRHVLEMYETRGGAEHKTMQIDYARAE